MKKIFLILMILLFSSNVEAVYEFRSKIAAVGDNCTDEDYNNLSDWEDAMDGSGSANLTSSNFVCGAWDGQSGSDIADGTSVSWDGGSSTGTLYHMTNRTGSTDYYLQITAGSLADDDTVTDSTNSFNINGTPDSCYLYADVYDDDGPIEGYVVITGFTFSKTNALTITSPPGERHRGVDDGIGSSLTYDSVPSNNAVIQVREEYVTIEYQHFDTWQSSGKSSAIEFYQSGTNHGIARYNLIHDSQELEQGYGIRAEHYGANAQYKFYNNIIYNINNHWSSYPSAGIYMSAMTDANELLSNDMIYNNTIYNCEQYGIRAPLKRIHNNLVVGTYDLPSGVTNGDIYTGTSTADLYNNAVSDSSAVGEGGTTGITTAVFKSVTPGSIDLRIVSGATDLIGTARDENIYFVDDVDRDVRGDSWDIGADQYSADKYYHLINSNAVIDCDMTIE